MTAPAGDPIDDRPALPFTVIGGFLGAGKTTLVNRVLASGAAGRAAVIVNDVGEVSVDAALIERHDGDTIALTNGCICCSLSTDFALALPDLLAADPPFDRVIVEASGVSDPGLIAQYGTLPGFRLDGVVVLADAETIVERAADPRIGGQVMRQLERADLVLLTKVDLVEIDRLADVRRWSAERFGPTPVVEVSEGRAPLDVVLGSDRAGHDVDLRQRSPGSLAELSERPIHGLETRTVVVPDGVSLDDLRTWTETLPPDVLRAKGLVRTAPDDQLVVLHVVGRRRRITPTRPAHSVPSPDGLGRVIVIGAAEAVAAIDPPSPGGGSPGDAV